MRYWFTFLYLTFCLLSPSAASLAQESFDPADILAPREGNKPDLKYKDEDLPIEFIKEALNFGEECGDSRIMSMYFDCHCMATEFLDQRIKLGPETDKEVIAQNVGPQCADGAGIAGRLYETCKQDYVSVPVELDLEEFCSCYGNTYAKLYERLGITLNSTKHIRLMTQSKLACRNPNLAQRFYGRNSL